MYEGSSQKRRAFSIGAPNVAEMIEGPDKPPFWGRGADDWIALQEPLQRPLYEALLDGAAIAPGSELLDAGCGSGVVSLIARQRGANVIGLDASPMFVEI